MVTAGDGRGPTLRTRAVALAVLAAALPAGCSAQTNPPSAVGTTTATLNGEMRCMSDVDGRWAWQWRQLGTSGWSSGAAFQVACPPDQRADISGYQWSGADQNPATPGFQDRGPGRPAYNLANLKPDTTYQYRLLADFGQPCDLRAPATCGDVAPFDSVGTPNGTRWDTLTTQPRCDDVQGASESLAAFASSNAAGTAASPKVLCMRQGTQNIGQFDGIKAWTTLTPRGKPNGTKEVVVLNGNVALDNVGATIEDVKVIGCYGSPGCPTSRDKVIDVRANNTALLHAEVSPRGGRNSDRIQCVHVGSDNSQLTGVRMEFSKSHSCGTEAAGNHYHGLYCRDAIQPSILGNWFYDNEGFGVQMWPNCDSAVAAGNVIAFNGGACDLSGFSPSRMSTNSVYRNGFCGFARESTLFPPVHCFNTASNQVVDMVLYDIRDPSSVTDCASRELQQSGTYNADPQFVDAGRYDFRMQNPFARAKLGVYAEIIPGPRW